MMKILKKTTLLLTVFLFGLLDVFAAKNMPPPPTGKKPPPPPGLPIGENSTILIAIALLFGFYVIYKYQFKTKKTPI